MTILHLEALATITVSLSILMAGAWVVQQRSGNSGWVDTQDTNVSDPSRSLIAPSPWRCSST